MVGKVREGDEGVVVEVKSAIGKVNCLHCSSTKIYGHGWCKPRKALHSWSNGKRVYLELHRQRWRCRECGRSFNNGAQPLRSYSRITRQAETEAPWQLKDRSFSQVRRELGVGYGTLRRLLEREIDEEALGFIGGEEAIFLGIDEHSFRHHELVYTVTEVKKRRVLGVLKDDRIATLKEFLNKIPKDKVKQVCTDMKDGLRKAVEALFPEAKVVVDHFHVIAESNRKMDEARRIEQDVQRRKKAKIPKKIFLVAGDKLSVDKRAKVDELLDQYPTLQGFYWAKEKMRELYQQNSLGEATRLLDNIIFNLKSNDDGELIRWADSLKYLGGPILNYFASRTTNGFTEGCNTKIKMLKRISYGLRNVEVNWRKMLLGFVPCRSYFHNI